MGTVLIGYDVETMVGQPQYPPEGWVRAQFGDSNAIARIVPQFLAAATELHRDLDVPATLFVSGRTLEENSAAVRACRQGPQIEVASHSYSHRPFKTVQEIRDGKPDFHVEGISFEEACTEIRAARQALDAAGMTGAGMTAPFSYSQGLLDKPDVRRILLETDFRYIRSWGRDENDLSPLSFDVQPFFYDDGLLEIPICHWFDVNWRFSYDGWNAGRNHNNTGFRDMLEAGLQAVAGCDRVWSTGFHDWPAMATDPELDNLRFLVGRGRELGVRFLSHEEFLSELIAGPDATVLTAGRKTAR